MSNAIIKIAAATAIALPVGAIAAPAASASPVQEAPAVSAPVEVTPAFWGSGSGFWGSGSGHGGWGSVALCLPLGSVVFCI